MGHQQTNALDNLGVLLGVVDTAECLGSGQPLGLREDKGGQGGDFWPHITEIDFSYLAGRPGRAKVVNLVLQTARRTWWSQEHRRVVSW